MAALFGFTEIWKFFFSFFLVLPGVTFLHEFGHYFFARIFGGKVRVHVGTGNVLMKIGPLRIRKLYFYDGWCEYVSLKEDAKYSKVLVYLGGSLFNLAAILLLNFFIFKGIFEANLFFYQFTYFSFYYVFFSLMPMEQSSGCPSDGLAALNTIKGIQLKSHPAD
jgi:hypothetical protein